MKTSAVNGSEVRGQRSYPKKKRLMYNELQTLPKEFDVIALSKMNNVRATQLMPIRKKFKDEIKITMIKNKIAKKAFENVKGVAGLDRLSEKLEGQSALMFTKVNPFKLNSALSRNKVYLLAKGGDVASSEIIIPAGNTGITPGPVLSEFKEANVVTRIDHGSIWINKDTVVARPGQVISQKLASLLSKLNIKPIEARISISFAISEGLIFDESDLNISFTKYRDELVRSFYEAVVLATESAYVTNATTKPLIRKAQQNAIALTRESQYISSKTLEEFHFPEAELHARLLAASLAYKGYTTA